MKYQTDVSGDSPIPRLVADVHERFALAEKGVSLEEFQMNPALHLRNLSRRLQGWVEQADAEMLPPGYK